MNEPAQNSRRVWSGVPRALLAIIGLTGLGAPLPASVPGQADAKLLQAIAQIRAIDNHAHPDPANSERIKPWDAKQPLGAPDYPDVWPLRRTNPAWLGAWRALYGYTANDFEPEHLSALFETKRSLLARGDEQWPATVLDRAGIDLVLINATRLGPGQSGARFRWVPYADPLLQPFAGEKSRYLYCGGPVSIAQLQREAGLKELPATVEDYLGQFVAPTLRRWREAGALAVKFLSAYGRTLDFKSVTPERAAALFARGRSGGMLESADQQELEDFLFHEICVRAGATGLVVHLHTGNGAGPYFHNARADPGLLETALNSRALRKTKFVLLHGGWPYSLIAQAMTDKPNTYVDFSAQNFYLTVPALAAILRSWLEWHPEKILFGTDAYSEPNTPLSDYEEKTWLMTAKSREALALALTGMMDDGLIDRAEAERFARMVLRDNAADLYGLSAAQDSRPGGSD